MTEFMKTQNSFADGEVSAEFFIRDNLNGLSRLENMDVIAGGGLRRRRGLQSFVTLNSSGRLIPFSVSESENYLLALIDGHLKIYNNSELVRDLLVIWDFADIEKIQYAQRFGTMIFVHPDYRPYVLTKTDSGFQLSEFAFEVNDADMFENMPFMKFDDATGVKITVTKNSAGNNYATFTTNKDFWRADNVGTRIMLLDKQWQITEYTSPTVVTAYTNSQYTLPSKPVSDWSESAFSARRGWPCSITFHQDRLVFGGSKSVGIIILMSVQGWMTRQYF